MDVRFKRLNGLAKIPTRGSKFSAGYDLIKTFRFHLILQ